MLLAIRERIMGFLGWVILSLIFVAFAFWGLDSYLQSSSITYAARVNDTEISSRQLENAYQSLAARLRETLGNDLDKAGFDEAMLRERALDNLVSEELLVQAADEAGFSVPDAAVAAEINSIDVFKQDGVFSKEQYMRVLRNQGMSPDLFEWTLKRDLIANQMKTGIAFTAAATSDDFSRIYRLEAQQRSFDHLLLPKSLVADRVTVSDADIEEYYSSNNNAYMSREQVRVQYIELDAADMQVDSIVDEERVEALYEEQAVRFVTPEERRARHILITPSNAGEQGVTDALARALAVADRLADGEDFAAVAADESDDPGSAGSGGDLGFFGTGIMAPEFEKAVFAMQVGELSKPVQTEFGFHIIELLEIRPEKRKPLAEVRDELVRELQADELADVFYDKADLMTNIAFEQPDTLEGVADALSIKIMESDWIGRDGGPGIGENEDIVAAIFAEDVLENSNNSPVIEISENHVIVLRVLEHQASTLKPLEDVREQVRQAVIASKTRALLEEQGAAYISELAAGDKTMSDLAANHGLKLEQNPLLNRNATTPDKAIVSKAFSMLPPREGVPVYGGFITPSGDYAIVALREVKDGSVGDLPEEQLTLARRGLNRILGSSEVQMVLDGIKARASVHVPGDDE
jgi:peptidyl-prolyl cis-trans isomerase D